MGLGSGCSLKIWNQGAEPCSSRTLVPDGVLLLIGLLSIGFRLVCPWPRAWLWTADTAAPAKEGPEAVPEEFHNYCDARNTTKEDLQQYPAR